MNFYMILDQHKIINFDDYSSTIIGGVHMCAHCGVSVKEIDGRLTLHLQNCKYRKEKEGFHEGPIPMIERRIQAGQSQVPPFPQTLKETFPPNPVVNKAVGDLESVIKELTTLSNQLNSDFTELVFHDANAGGKQGLAMNKLSLAHQRVQEILNQLTGRSNA